MPEWIPLWAVLPLKIVGALIGGAILAFFLYAIYKGTSDCPP